MKKTGIVLLVLWIVIAAGLIAALIFGLSSTVFRDRVSRFFRFEPIIMEPTSGEWQLISTREYTGIDILSVDWTMGEAEIIASDAETVTVEEYCRRDLSKGEQMTVEQNGKKLTIDFNGDKTLISMPEKKLTVSVPSGILDNLSVNGVSADLTVSDITAKEIETNTVSGAISCRGNTEKLTAGAVSGDLTFDVFAEEIEISSTSGKITVNANTDDRFRIFKADTVSGDVRLSASVCPEKLNVSTTSGNVELTLSDDASFGLDYSSISGDLRNEFPTVPDGECDFNVSTVSGDLSIYRE